MIPLLPVVVTAFGAAAWWKSRQSQKGIMTPERKYIFTRLLASKITASQFREQAVVWKQEGFPEEAKILIEIANNKELPQETKQAYRAAMTKAMNSTDPNSIRALADAFEKKYYLHNAQHLRAHANAVEAANKVVSKPVNVTAEVVEEKVQDTIPVKKDVTIDAVGEAVH